MGGGGGTVSGRNAPISSLGAHSHSVHVMEQRSMQVSATNAPTFLGIELDSARLVAQLPADELARVQQLVSEWGNRKVCTKRELLSLIAILQHVTIVVKFGRFSLHQIIDLSITAGSLTITSN